MTAPKKGGGSSTWKDVYVEAVEDHLNGTPHARHPVQFERTSMPDLWACTLCGALVRASDQDLHRTSHDNHNRVHDEINQRALTHKREPSQPTERKHAEHWIDCWCDLTDKHHPTEVDR